MQGRSMISHQFHNARLLNSLFPFCKHIIQVYSRRLLRQIHYVILLFQRQMAKVKILLLFWRQSTAKYE
ncbi:hypothetical protein AQUCO_00700380v1 [Aquilegia coerulea]|uniref:Uncharacterized protein n=1 Tax=Aquilegia coerulea TaxID=218851 RepID=A0A2G5EJT8_AQUCA|nr:hypothetical protein AQUCO_00700380v1 [Aquilegia coerulea]